MSVCTAFPILLLFVYVYLALPFATYSLHFANTFDLSTFLTTMSAAFPEICLLFGDECISYMLLLSFVPPRCQ